MEILRQFRRTALSKVGMVLLILVFVPATVDASPFGQGLFGADVPFGSQTSLSINLGGDVNLALAPNGGSFTGSGSHTVTVTSTDVVGYILYARAVSSTDLTSCCAAIPASANGSDAPLATNTWGYNTTGSTSDFVGMTMASRAIKTTSGPYKNGDNTTITYGVKTNVTQAAGSYQMSVVYTAVAPNP